MALYCHSNTALMNELHVYINPFNASCSKLLLLEGFSAILIYLGFWKGPGLGLKAAGARLQAPCCAPPWNFYFNFLNENGVFLCTPGRCFKINVSATEGLASDVRAACL